MKANDEEEKKWMLGFCCEIYGDPVKKWSLIRLYMSKQFHNGWHHQPNMSSLTISGIHSPDTSIMKRRGYRI